VIKEAAPETIAKGAVKEVTQGPIVTKVIREMIVTEVVQEMTVIEAAQEPIAREVVQKTIANISQKTSQARQGVGQEKNLKRPMIEGANRADQSRHRQYERVQKRTSEKMIRPTPRLRNLLRGVKRHRNIERKKTKVGTGGRVRKINPGPAQSRRAEVRLV
jgi:hypothetical protein